MYLWIAKHNQENNIYPEGQTSSLFMSQLDLTLSSRHGMYMAVISVTYKMLVAAAVDL